MSKEVSLLTLPEARNPLAAKVIELSATLQKYVSPGLNVHQFLTLVVAEGNALSLQMKDDVMQDARTKMSFAKAAFNAAVVGLLPGAALGHCYFIPFRRFRGKPNEHTEIVYVPGYRGYLELAFASNFLAQCDPEVVLRGESVVRSHTEDGPKLLHDLPTPRGQLVDRSTLIGAYCTYKTVRGGKGVVWVDRAEIDDVDTKRDIWGSNYHAMCLKVPIRRASKRWHLTRQLAHAIALDEAYEDERPQTDVAGITQSDPVPEIDLASIVEDSE